MESGAVTGSCTQSRYQRDNADLLSRLRKVEGQVRGVERMVADDRYCVDILVQIGAVRAALGSIGASVLESHVRGCVASALQRGDGAAAVDELVDVLNRTCR